LCDQSHQVLRFEVLDLRCRPLGERADDVDALRAIRPLRLGDLAKLLQHGLYETGLGELVRAGKPQLVRALRLEPLRPLRLRRRAGGAEPQHLDVGHAPLACLHRRALGDAVLVEEGEQLEVGVLGGGALWRSGKGALGHDNAAVLIA
jgi:hypothetical protein